MRMASKRRFLILSCLAMVLTKASGAQQPNPPSSSVAPAIVELTPAEVTAEVGQQLTFAAVGKNAAGEVMPDKPTFWFAAPFDLAAAEKGVVTVYQPGEVRVGAVIGGKTGYAKVTVHPAPVAEIGIATPAALVPGATEILQAMPRNAKGDPLANVRVTWKSDTPSIARVDDTGVVTALRSGQAQVRAVVGSKSAVATVRVVKNPLTQVTVLPMTTQVKTGDLVHFKLSTGLEALHSSYVSWSVVGRGAVIYSDGAFVAEQPGTYIVKATVGHLEGSRSVIALPRNVER